MIHLTRIGDSLQVRCPSETYHDIQLKIIKSCSSSIMNQTEDELELIYQVPKHWQSIEELRKQKLSHLERLQLCSLILSLEIKLDHLRVPFIHPNNLFIYGEKIKIIHYGIENCLSPQSLSSHECLRQLKAILSVVLIPKLDFEETITALCINRNALLKKIDQCSNLTDLIHFVNREYKTCKLKKQKTKVEIRKKFFQVLLVMTIMSSVFAITFGIYFFYYIYPDYQFHKQVVKAQQAFIQKDYGYSMKLLHETTVSSLNKEAKYILAVSSIELDSLTKEQKQNILPSITMATSDELLDYWIYVGRGEFEQALNLSKVLGDSQLILHAYTHLYEAIESTRDIDGDEKQEKLEEIKGNIKELTEDLTE